MTTNQYTLTTMILQDAMFELQNMNGEKTHIDILYGARDAIMKKQCISPQFTSKISNNYFTFDQIIYLQDEKEAFNHLDEAYKFTVKEQEKFK